MLSYSFIDFYIIKRQSKRKGASFSPYSIQLNIPADRKSEHSSIQSIVLATFHNSFIIIYFYYFKLI